jgi:lipopolysaccharide/colanic/teichoic acid biosynthesis glycosyltransferase
MSSISFDTVFPAEPENRSNQAPQRGPAINGNRAPNARSERAPAGAALYSMAGEPSPWVMSALRRFLDCSAAVGALIAFAPLMLVAAGLVRLGSGGPILFRQRRMGRNGKEFTLYKFRSMRSEGARGSSITVVGDARITPVGAFLRRYKLDELPQFWNVLRGDMGLVGPRPKLPHHEALHLPCRPGITGTATLAFHKEEEFLSAIPEDELEAFYEMFVKPAKANMDMEYMRSATLASDVAILWRTASSCLLGTDRRQPGPAEVVARYGMNWKHGDRVHPSIAAAAALVNETRIHVAVARPRS